MDKTKAVEAAKLVGRLERIEHSLLLLEKNPLHEWSLVNSRSGAEVELYNDEVDFFVEMLKKEKEKLEKELEKL